MDEKEIQRILSKYRVIAVVGLSENPEKPSYEVSEYMQNHGYKIIPVNPFVKEVLGEKSCESLLDVPEELQKTIEVVDIFRRPEEVLPVVEQAVQLKKRQGRPFVVWMQLGIVNKQAAEVAEEAGLIVIMDKCMKVEHKRLC